jgi:hypothetical protein
VATHRRAKPQRATPDPKVVFLVADQYWKASWTMAEAPHMQDVLLPSVVCAAFALELYFKSLRIMDKGAYSDEHNLRALFDQLGAPTQQRIRALFVPYLLAAQKADDDISDAGGHPRSTVNFDSVLDASRQAFKFLRYVHEGLPPMSGWSASGISKATRQAILERHPDWETAKINLRAPIIVSRI